MPMRSMVLRDLPIIIAEAGGVGDSFFSELRRKVDFPNEKNAFIGSRVVEFVLEEAANRFNIPDLGLRMAARQDPRILGPLAVAMENSRTFGEALECANRFLSVLSPALVQDVIPDPDGDPTTMGLRLANTLGISSPQFLDYGLGLEHRVLMMVTRGRPYGLQSVLVPHEPTALESTYRAYFGSGVVFNASDAALLVPQAVLRMPVRGGDELLRRMAVDFLESHYAGTRVSVAELVTEILQRDHGLDTPSLPEVARALNLHERSLQRLLAVDGTGFAELLDDVRRDQARHLISYTNLPFSQIAFRLGLREQSSLTHACKRWFGVPPSQLRKSAKESRLSTTGGVIGRSSQ